MRVGDGTDREVAPRFAAICHWLSPRTLLQEGRDHREEVNWAKRGQVGVGGGSEYETVAIETPICHNSALARYTDGRKTTDEPLTPVRGRYTISLYEEPVCVKDGRKFSSKWEPVTPGCPMPVYSQNCFYPSGGDDMLVIRETFQLYLESLSSWR